MTDDTGLLEHCLGNIPRRAEGYTTDDNARALWTCVEWLELLSSAETTEMLKEKLYTLIDRYLAFLMWAQREDGRFHNNIAYDRSTEEERPSDDCLGRALWACARAFIKLTDNERKIAIQEMFSKSIKAVDSLVFPRGWAYALAACSLLLHHIDRTQWRTDAFCDSTFTALPDVADRLESQLIALFRKNAKAGWNWFEPVMTYGNGVMPWSLFCAYQVNRRQETLEVAQASLDFLIAKMTGREGIIRPIGNRGWCTIEHRSDWDQQPLEVMKLALASAQAYVSLGESAYWEVLKKCRDWFYGNNDLRTPLVDVEEGSCCDGLMSEGVNRNRGAESTLSYLLTEAIYRNIELEVDASCLLQSVGN
jgi:hypothetical protein